MAIYRNVQLSFWTDNKVEDDFTPEDKYFYMYLLTNPQTNICGCYEVSYNQMSRHTGYNKDTIMRLIERFEKVHKVIAFNKETKEILILRWYKYNWCKSKDTLKGIRKTARFIKSDQFREYVLHVVDCLENDTPIRRSVIDEVDPLETSDTDTVSDADSISDSGSAICTRKRDTYAGVRKEIVDYLNTVCGTRYRANSKTTISHVNARLEEGFTLDDFKVVIDKKAKEWTGTQYEKFLTPDTLFCTKFEKYLNQKIIPEKKPRDAKTILDDSYGMMQDWCNSRSMEGMYNDG